MEVDTTMGGTQQKGAKVNPALLEVAEETLQACDALFVAWYEALHGKPIERAAPLRQQSFLTRYRPHRSEAGLLRHVDGAQVDGSIILALPTPTGFTGGGVKVWEPDRNGVETETHYPMPPGDLCVLDNLVWHEGVPITAGERWSLVIFYQTRVHLGNRLLDSVKAAADHKLKGQKAKAFAQLAVADTPAFQALVAAGGLAVGDVCECLYHGAGKKFYEVTLVAADPATATFTVEYDDGERWDKARPAHIRAKPAPPAPPPPPVPPPAAAGKCVACARTGASAAAAYECVPCGCAVLCATHARKMATGGKCGKCGTFFSNVRRVRPPGAAGDAAAGSSTDDDSDSDGGAAEPLPVYVVNAFASTAEAGNPAGVVLLPRALAVPAHARRRLGIGGEQPPGAAVPDAALQDIAKRVNLSETSFVTLKDGAAEAFATSTRFNLRWFTPTKEVDLCGHGTLAAATAIMREAGNANRELRFDTLSGELVVTRAADHRGEGNANANEAPVDIALPLNPPGPVPAELAEAARALAAVATAGMGAAAAAELAYSPRTKKLVVRLADADRAAARRHLEQGLPGDFPKRLVEAKRPYPAAAITGVMVTARADDFDFVSRYFAPWNGIDEDPVTGSAHTVLCPFWAQVLGKTVLRCRQCSKRGGDIVATVGAERVVLRTACCVAGRGVEKWRGALELV